MHFRNMVPVDNYNLSSSTIGSPVMFASTAVSKRPHDTDLMLPPPIKRMKRPPSVLSEEDYNAGLDYIIARDYFPGLLESDAQQDYLNALEARDEQWMEDAGHHLKAIMTPKDSARKTMNMSVRRLSPGTTRIKKTPSGWVGETPGATPVIHTGSAGVGDDSKGPAAYETSMSLNSYQAKYTSEDNASFGSVVDEQNARRRDKYRWLWSGTNKMPSKQQSLQHRQSRQKNQQRALDAPHYFSARYTSTPSSSTALIRASDAQLSLRPLDRPAMIDKRPHKPRNGLFFNPDDMAETHPHLPSRAETAAQMSKTGAKGVSHANTRINLDAAGFAQTEATEEEAPHSPTMSAVDAAVQGRSHPSMKKGGLYAESEAGTEEGAGGDTPMVGGWKFVDAEVPVETPPPQTPRRSDKVDHDALLNSLIQSGNGSEDEGARSGNPFNIAEPRKREELHHAMVEKQNKAKRAMNDRLAALKGQDLGKTPRFMSSPRVGAQLRGAETPGNAKRRLGGLTPAGRALYDKIGGKMPIAGRRMDATPFGGNKTPKPVRRTK